LAAGRRAVYRLRIMRIDEIFCSIQGEGSRRGRPCTFVRLTGCPLRCRWCDTTYAFHGGEDLPVEQVLERVAGYRPRLVCVTGGEPLAQESVHELMGALLDRGYEVVLETSGALDARRVDPRVVRILDLKAPGSGESARNHWPTFDELRPTDEVKFVIADRADFDWALEVIRERGLTASVACVLLSPVHGELEGAKLAEWMLEEDLPLVLQLQEHKILWPGVERGV
jgi:7-carboxy-7-deazaguanine synthase